MILCYLKNQGDKCLLFGLVVETLKEHFIPNLREKLQVDWRGPNLCCVFWDTEEVEYVWNVGRGGKWGLGRVMESLPLVCGLQDNRNNP